jgi:hypothetical protein
MKSIPKISLWVLAALSVIVGIFFYVGGISGTLTAGTDSFDIPTYTNMLVVWTYILLILAVVLTLAMVTVKFIAKMGSDSKSGIKAILSIVGLVVVLLITFLVGSTEPIEIIGYEGADNGGFWSQFSDMCLYSIYVLIIGAFLTIVAVNVFKQIKK